MFYAWKSTQIFHGMLDTTGIMRCCQGWILLFALSLLCVVIESCGKDGSSSTSPVARSSDKNLSAGSSYDDESDDDKYTPEMKAAGIEKWERMKRGVQADDTDIVFYGIVRDQDKAPVEGVMIPVGYRHYDEKVIIGSSDMTVYSDKDGRFIIKGIRGTELFIRPMLKSGYEYHSHMNNRDSFDYRKSGIDPFVPNEKTLVEFIIRKKNPPTVVIPTGLYANRPYWILVYGKVYYYHIDSEKCWEEGKKPDKIQDTSPDIKIVVTGVKEDREIMWKTNITISSLEKESGVIVSHDRLYTAPEEGYKETVDSGLLLGTNSPDNEIFIYVKKNGPIYARLDLDISPNPDSVTLDVKSWTNPTGDRNLEYDEDIYKEYLKKQEEERKKRRTLVIPMKSRMELRYGTIYYYNVLAAKYWDEGHRPDNMTPDIKIVTTLSEENGKDKAKFIISAVAKGDQVLVGEKIEVAPADEYKDIVGFEYVNRPIYAGYMGYVYLKQEGPIYSRLDFYGSVDVDMARFSISSWTNPTGARNLEYDEDIYKEYLKKKEEEEKKHK